MSKRILFISVLLFSVISSVQAQQEKLLTNFIFDKMSVNPGATGIDIVDGICATSIYRNQWDKVNGAPNSVLFNVEANLSRYFPSAVGISYYHDAIGFNRQNNLTANYSFHLPVANGVLGIGAAIGMVSYGNDPIWQPVNTPAALDPSLNDTKISQAGLDANFGLYYKHNDGWYAGLSAVHLSETELDLLTFTTKRHYYVMGGYTYELNSDIDIEGNVLVRTDAVKFSSDINVRGIYQNNFYGGLTFRPNDAIGIMAGVTGFNVGPGFISGGYSYDVTVNRLKGNSWGSHELFVKYCYMLPPVPRTVTRNPRWL